MADGCSSVEVIDEGDVWPSVYLPWWFRCHFWVWWNFGYLRRW